MDAIGLIIIISTLWSGLGLVRQPNYTFDLKKKIFIYIYIRIIKQYIGVFRSNYFCCYVRIWIYMRILPERNGTSFCSWWGPKRNRDLQHTKMLIVASYLGWRSYVFWAYACKSRLPVVVVFHMVSLIGAKHNQILNQTKLQSVHTTDSRLRTLCRAESKWAHTIKQFTYLGAIT